VPAQKHFCILTHDPVPIKIVPRSLQNVRELKKQRTNLRRLFNKAIIKHDNPSLNVITKLYTLLYSSFAEVCFLKMIHTPYGFSETFITEIFKQRSLEEQWNKSIECAFSQVLSIPNRGEIQNKKRILIRHLKKYIIEPSQIRNKIAHGQWAIVLNCMQTSCSLQMGRTSS
jgi:hypothetical protein